MHPSFRKIARRETSMHHDLIESCTEACMACAQSCKECLKLPRGDPYKAHFVQSCRECAQHCVICAWDLRENSRLLVQSSRMCALACELCAIECMRYNDDHIKRCEAACRVCADKCRAVRQALGMTVIHQLQT